MILSNDDLQKQFDRWLLKQNKKIDQTKDSSEQASESQAITEKMVRSVNQNSLTAIRNILSRISSMDKRNQRLELRKLFNRNYRLRGGVD
jgi:ribosomal protein L17